MSQATLKVLHKFYKSNLLDMGLFFYIEGIRKVLPSVSIMKCIELYQEAFEFDEFEMDSDTAMVTYQRMKKKFNNYKDERKN